jgi:hypothetical protein
MESSESNRRENTRRYPASAHTSNQSMASVAGDPRGRNTFRGDAPATPRKSSRVKQSSVFPSFSTRRGFESKVDEVFGRADMPLSEGTVQEEFERYVSGSGSPRDTDIIHFWEVSFSYMIRNEHSQSR